MYMTIRSRVISKPRDLGSELSDRSKIVCRLGNTDTTPVKFQSDKIISTLHLATLRLREIWWWDVLPVDEKMPGYCENFHRVVFEGNFFVIKNYWFWIGILSFSFEKLHLKMSSVRMAAILSSGVDELIVVKICVYSCCKHDMQYIIIDWRNRYVRYV